MPSLFLERATVADDEQIRALLRRTPMDGEIRLTFEREPELALSDSIEGDRHHTFVARDAESRVRGVCSRAVRRVWFNGEPRRIGYLGQLRCELPLRGTLKPLVDGFARCGATHEPDELPFDLTSIMTGNKRARRLLERGLPGLPRYVPLTNFKTMLIPRGRRVKHAVGGVRVETGSRESIAEMAMFLQSQYQRFQFAPVWAQEDLLSAEVTRDLRPEDFFIAIEGGRITGCAALWDQSRFKQTVVRGYASPLSRVRPLVNMWMKLTNQPRLPSVGSQVRFRTISHLAVENDDPRTALALLDSILEAGSTKPLDFFVLGLATGHPLRQTFEAALRPRVLDSILYTVHKDGSDFEEPDGRVPHLEVATL